MDDLNITLCPNVMFHPLVSKIWAGTILLKTVKVIERSGDVTPKSKYEKLKGHLRSPCAPNMVEFRTLFPELRHFEKDGARHFSLIGRHLESVSRTKPVFEGNLAMSEKKADQRISVRFGNFFFIELSF